MGCDIHAYVEVVDHYPDGCSFAHGFAALEMDRNYGLFAVLAGVRNDDSIRPLSEPRGVPPDLSSLASDDYWLMVDDELAAKEWDGYISAEAADRSVQYGAAERVLGDSLRQVANSDWHSASWLTLSEMEEAQRRFAALAYPDPGTSRELRAIVEMMRGLQDATHTARLVFWFDN